MGKRLEKRQCHARESGHPDLAARAGTSDSRFRGNDTTLKDLILERRSPLVRQSLERQFGVKGARDEVQSAGQSVSKRNARPSRDSQQNPPSLRAQRSNPGATARGPWIASSQGLLAMTVNGGRLPCFEHPSVIRAEFTTKLRLIVINPCLKRSSMHSCKKEV